MKTIFKFLIYFIILLIGGIPVAIGVILATKTKIQILSFINKLPENTLIVIGICIAICCVFVMYFAIYQLFEIIKNE